MFRTLLVCAAVSASTIACSGAPQPRPDSHAAATAARPCGIASASRIPESPDACSASPGRTYSQQDVERTGQTDVADALRMLDPSVSVHH